MGSLIFYVIAKQAASDYTNILLGYSAIVNSLEIVMHKSRVKIVELGDSRSSGQKQVSAAIHILPHGKNVAGSKYIGCVFTGMPEDHWIVA